MNNFPNQYGYYQPPNSYPNQVYVPPNSIVDDDLQPTPLRRWSCESAQMGGERENDGRGGAAAATATATAHATAEASIMMRMNEGTLPASSYYHNLGATNHLHMSTIEQPAQGHVGASGYIHHLPHHQLHQQVQHQPVVQCVEQSSNQRAPQLSYRENEVFQNSYYKHNVRSVSAPSIGNNGYGGGRIIEFSARRRFRTNFTEQQSLFLEDSFRESHYPDHKSKKDMATYLNIPEDRITVWFQNRRAKWRRKETREKERSRSDNCGPSCSFDYPCYPSSSDSSAFLPPTFPVMNNYDEHQYSDLKPDLLENQSPYSISSSHQ